VREGKAAAAAAGSGFIGSIVSCERELPFILDEQQEYIWQHVRDVWQRWSSRRRKKEQAGRHLSATDEI